MAKLKDMSAEPVKGKQGEDTTPVIKERKLKTARRPSQYRTGYGKFTTTVIMKNTGGLFVKVNRNDVLKRIDAGWVPVCKRLYREALAGGAAVAVSEVSVKVKK